MADETGVWVLGLTYSASFLGDALLNPFNSSYIPDAHSHVFVLSLHSSCKCLLNLDSAKKWARIFGLPGYNDLSPSLSLKGGYLLLSYATREPADLSTGSASSFNIKLLRIDK